jgi:HEPN domain-containing protein
MRIEVERLLKQAERDPRNAGRNIDIDAHEVAAFLAAQAVEKYLKGAWIGLRGESPPWTHSLTELGDAFGAPPHIRPKLVYLNADYTTARYPDAANGIPYEIYDCPTSEAKVAAAAEVFEWLRTLIRV